MIALRLPTRLVALLLAVAACPVHALESAPTPRPSVAEQARAFGTRVKEDAKAVGKAAQEEGKKIGAASRKQAAALKTRVKAHTAKADRPEGK